MITTIVVPRTSNQLGQEVLLSSAFTSFKNWKAFFNVVSISLPNLPAEAAGGKDLAGQEGFEPPTPGFGVRCSSRSSYWPERANLGPDYFNSLCTVWERQDEQYFLNSSFPVVVFRFLVPV